MKCQKCTKAATLHITELVTEEQVEELHLCEECAHKYLYSPQQQKQNTKIGPLSPGDESEEPAMLNRECQVCGLKFDDFRNTGPLPSPHAYQTFPAQFKPHFVHIHT